MPDYIYTAHNYTSTAFNRVIWHPEYIQIGWFQVSVECRLQFPKPTAYFNMSLSTDYTLIFERQQLLKGDIFLDLLYNCKPEYLCKQNHNNVLIQILTCKNRNCLGRHCPIVWVCPHWYITYLNLHSYWQFLYDKYKFVAHRLSGLASVFQIHASHFAPQLNWCEGAIYISWINCE